MEYNINIFNILISFGMLQGFIFGSILCWRSKLKGTQAYLGFTVLFLSFYLLWVLKYDFGFQKQLPEIQFLPVLFLWGIGPAFYAYLRSLFGKPIPIKTIRKMFIPLVVEQLFFNSCTVVLWLNDWNINEFNSFESFWVFNIFSIEHIVGLTIIAVYLFKSYQLLKNAGVLYASNKIRSILFCFGILWLIWVPYTMIDIIYYNFEFPPSKFYAFYLLFAILTYGIGFYGFGINKNTFTKVALPELITKNNPIGRVVDSEMETLAAKIKKVMEDEALFLNPDLNLSIFSEKVALHPNKVSAIINSALDYSFRDFVNLYRVNLFKEHAKTYDLKSKTLLGLAHDCGFNSKASFNRAFKKFNDCTPIEYVETLNQN